MKIVYSYIVKFSKNDMIARIMTCTSYKNEVLEKFTNEEYSEFFDISFILIQ